jgi:hypothetical protein
VVNRGAQRILWGVFLLLSFFALAQPRAQLVLSEFQASNISTLREDDGNFEDWIEIANVSTASVNLAGWYLTDDSIRLTRWQFPSTNLAAGQFLIVFASNKDRRTVGQPLHTNFKLAKEGEYLALVKPDGLTIATAYAPSFPPQWDNLSYGLLGTNGTTAGLNLEQHVYFTTPTPGAANGSGATALGPAISEVQHSPGVPGDKDDLVVQAHITPTLRPVKSVTLRYCVMYVTEVAVPMYDDGAHDDGAAGDGLFGARIPASVSIPGHMVRYRLIATDMNNQETRAPAFANPTQSPQYFGTVVYDPVLTNSRLPAFHWFIANPQAASSNATARCSVFYNGEFYDNIGVHVHGQSTLGFPKQSYHFVFNPGQKLRWSDTAPRVGELNLLTTWADKSQMRNVVAYNTYREGGAPGHFAFPVRVQQNRTFYSVANVVENGDDDFLQRLGLDPRGALYKMNNAADSVVGAEKQTRKEEGAADLQALIDGMSQASIPARQAFLFDHLNVPEIVDFLAAKVITADIDFGRKNYYLYRDSDGTGEWQIMPWDVDLSFGRVWSCGTTCLQYFDETIYTNQDIFVGNGNRIVTPLYSTPATRQMFLRRLRTVMDELLQPPDTPATNDHYRVQTLAWRDQIAPDAVLDLAKWGTWGTRETITQAVNRIWNEFLPGRRAFLFRTMSVASGKEIPASQPGDALVQFGDLQYRVSSGDPAQEWLSLTNANDYAVDLSRWRLEGGVRLVFAPGTVIPARATLFMTPDLNAFRRRQTSPKGGEQRLVVGPYTGELSAWGDLLSLWDPTGRLVSSNSYSGSPSLAQRFLRITEIFYHPDPLPGNTNVDASLFEFVELRNIGPTPLDLRSVRFAKGIGFDFSTGTITNLSPGARLLLVRDTNAFAQRYGSGLPVAGPFSGRLDNQGDRLRLEDAYGEVILDFHYDNQWSPATDGLGCSLTIVDDTLGWSQWGEKASWRSSSRRGGSPGQDDPLLGTGRLNIALLSGGYRLQYIGTPARMCQWERSADLVNWIFLGGATIPANGISEYLESSPVVGRAFFRAREP